MEDRRITPASNGNDPSAAGGYQQQPVAAAQRLSDMAAAAVEDDNRLLDDEFPLEGGVEQQPAAAVVVQQQQPPSGGRTSSKRLRSAAAAAAANGAMHNGEGVLPQPHGLDHDDGRKAYGEMGRPVVLPANLSADVKSLVDEGWKNNAFNQYASDLISVHRSLPDPRDEWWVEKRVVFFRFYPVDRLLYLRVLCVRACVRLTMCDKSVDWRRPRHSCY